MSESTGSSSPSNVNLVEIFKGHFAHCVQLFNYFSIANRVTDPPVDGIDCGAPAARWLKQFLGKENISLVLITPDVTLRQINWKAEEGNKDSMNVWELSFTSGTIYQ